MTTHQDVVTAAGFSGPLTGAVTGDVTGDLTGAVIQAVTNFTGDGAIGPDDLVASMSKGSAAAMTLAAPGAANVGKRLFIYAASAQAHVITITGLITTNNTLTFGGALGDSIELYAASATAWVVISSNNVTLSTV